ncbi:MAG: phosphodiester glycosidase family protein [Candidatus Levybacteria bacterium]|nr:phosphodiester glycosidase family protein [Candidatus Levybacteria bacterium]
MPKLPYLHALNLKTLVLLVAIVAVVAGGIAFYSLTMQTRQQGQITMLSSEKTTLQGQLASTSAQLQDLLDDDQYKINQDLKTEIANIQKTYKKAVTTYESLVKVKDVSKNIKGFDAQFAKSLTLLSDKNYASADAELSDLTKKIQAENDKVSSSFSIPANVPEKNTPPGSGFSRQQVNAGIGTYLVDIVSADLGSTRVIVDTASDGTCTNSCPVLSLGAYVSRSGGYAGINGSYFCPESYPSCAGKTNSFDTLLMNKNKVYFNSDNNKFSTVPAVVFLGGSIRFVGQSVEWGRDTGIDGMIANQPLLLSGGNITFGGDGDPKKGSKGSRSFVGNKGNTVYIGVVHNVTVAEAAHVLKAMGLENALNLDSGGSTALWYSGYKVGPGRNIPNAIVFVRK